jgi:hypothetical protein
MADETDRSKPEDVRMPDPPLPDESGLSLAIQRAIGHETRYRSSGRSSPTTS